MRRLPALVAAVAVAGFCAWGLRAWFWPDEEARVRRAAADLARAVSEVGAAGGGLALVAALNGLRPHLDEAVVLEAPERGVRVEGRDQVLGLASRLAAAGARRSLSLEDVTVTLSGDAATAAVAATATWRGTQGDGQAVIDAMEVALEFSRTDEGWRLRHGRTVEVLR